VKVSSDIITGVAFVGCKKADGTYLLKGSVFFVGLEKVEGEPGKVQDLVWVTARHVIDGIRKLGCLEVHVRLNTKDGTARWHATNIGDWFSTADASCDIALYSAPLPADADHTACSTDMILTPEIQVKHSFGVTDDVIVVGLFQHRAGNRRNAPIVRHGTLASVDEEEAVSTKLGDMPAYLIECRSIGGLSGSPVFVVTGIERQFTGKAPAGSLGIYLLGLIHGHYDVKDTEIDQLDAFDASDGLKPDQVNTGIAIVTPARRLLLTIEAMKAARPKPLSFDLADYKAAGGSIFKPLEGQFTLAANTDPTIIVIDGGGADGN
jgi:hypothetical protein